MAGRPKSRKPAKPALNEQQRASEILDEIEPQLQYVENLAMTLEHDLDRRQRNTANQLRMYVGFIRAKTDPREMLKAMEEMGKLMGLYSHKLEIAVEAPRTPEEVERRRLELIDELVGRGLIEPPKNGSE